MNIVMTGATGFVGRAALLRLLRDGHHITAWVRSPARARSTLGAEVDLIDAAGGTPALQRAVAGADAIVNLAGEPVLPRRWTARRRAALIHSRVGLTEQLAGAARAAPRPPRVLISASAVGYYGDRGSEPLDEHSPPGTGFLADLCARWEAAAQVAAQAGTRVAMLRLGMVLGPGSRTLQAMAPLFRAGLGGPIGTGAQYVPWIHIDDAVELIARALTDPGLAGPINAVAPQAVTNRDLAATLGRVLGRPAVLPVPRPLLRLALGQASTLLTNSARVLPRRAQEHGIPFRMGRLDQTLAHSLGHIGSCEIGPVEHQPRTPYLQHRRARYLLRQVTVIPAPIDQVFDFFARAENLSILTPPSMSFRIITPTPIDMAPGTAIDYRIALGPVPMRWRTVIEKWEPGKAFVDAQHRGPYHAWWHEHVFEADGDRTIISDRVYYAPPLGLLGRLANQLFVAPMLRRIFAFRSAAVALRFGHPEPGAASRAANAPDAPVLPASSTGREPPRLTPPRCPRHARHLAPRAP